MKLPLFEPGYLELRAELRRWEGVTSSALLSVEAIRACARYGTGSVELARAGLRTVALVTIDDVVLTLAAELEPVRLRSLDAIHLATALSLGDDVGAFIAYDDRLLAAAEEHGLPAVMPR